MGHQTQSLDVVIVVAGIPGSGKTTLARKLAATLRVALISKDTIKEALFDALGESTLDWSRKLGQASHVVMYALARQCPSAVLESHFWPGVSEAELQGIGKPLIQVYCSCPLELAVARYDARSADPSRHKGHLVHSSQETPQTWRTTEPRPLDLDAPCIEVNTAEPVDIDRLAAEIVRLIRPRESQRRGSEQS